MSGKTAKHGQMDITEQEQTFHGFVRFVTYSIIGIALVLIFLAIVGA